MKAIVTGAAGFIGFHVARRLAREGFEVIAIDNLNDYYQVALKETRLLALGSLANIRFAIQIFITLFCNLLPSTFRH